MLELKVMGICWVMAVVVIPVLGQLQPADASEKLMYGSSQVVLAVVVLGLATSIIWVTRRLMKSQDERVNEAKINAKEQVTQANCYTEEMTKALTNNAAALSQNAIANQQLKEAVYHLSEVVDKKLGLK